MTTTGQKCLAVSRCVSLLTVVMVTTPARACPMCKDGTTTDTAAAVASGAPVEASTVNLNTSIYALLGVLGLAGTAVGRAMVKAVRGSAR